MRDGRKVVGRHPEYGVRHNLGTRACIERKESVFTEHYEGFVYCAEVPTHHTLVTRRNGKVLISGNCTGNAGIGCMGTGVFFGDRGSHYTLDESGAVALYSDATKADPYPGTYPPTDSGSDGLTVAKVLKAAGEIAGYTHTFTLNDALLALTVTPWITGVEWTEAMFDPDPDGRVHPTGAVAGGHEFVADELDVENERVWFCNSWGPSFGIDGRFYLTFDDFGALLKRDGDVTVFVPLTQPAPVPTPPAPPAPPEPTPTPPEPADCLATLREAWHALGDWLTSKGA
jgi:hypothetical protein